MVPPVVVATRNVAPLVDQLGTFLDAPGLGRLAVNAFVMHSREPVLVDAGVVALKDGTLAALESVIDPADLRWIYLTHVDADHVGCLDAVLARAKNARVVTTFLGMAKLGLVRSISPERFFLLNPGQELDVGDRKLRALAAPCYDAPETTMLFDPSARVLFSSDYFGTFLPNAVDTARDVRAEDLRAGMTTFLTIDSPWLAGFSPDHLTRATRTVVELAPEIVLSSHLPPARGMVDALTANVHAAAAAPPARGPDQAAFIAMMAAAATS